MDPTLHGARHTDGHGPKRKRRRAGGALSMVSRYAVMIDGGIRGRRKALAEHLTCRACQGHHVAPIDAHAPSGYRYRAAERSAAGQRAFTLGPDEAPTHQCRDCGFQWVIATAPPSPDR
jgi:hypothetical protein